MLWPPHWLHSGTPILTVIEWFIRGAYVVILAFETWLCPHKQRLCPWPILYDIRQPSWIGKPEQSSQGDGNYPPFKFFLLTIVCLCIPYYMTVYFSSMILAYNDTCGIAYQSCPTLPYTILGTTFGHSCGVHQSLFDIVYIHDKIPKNPRKLQRHQVIQAILWGWGELIVVILRSLVWHRRANRHDIANEPIGTWVKAWFQCEVCWLKLLNIEWLHIGYHSNLYI